MCDTVAALGTVTARGGVLFAKNSDRERNEAQAIESIPRRPTQAGRRLRATYIEIDDAAATHACLISRPRTMWGAEIGANEHGVVIGNEAQHALVLAQRRRALTGMDLVRLGLERAATAAQAVEVITRLLEAHGQGGNCGQYHRFYYHNGFVVADAREAYVIETVGRWWVVEKVSGIRALSNALSIGASVHDISPALRAHAVEQGWTGTDGSFDFAARLIDPARDAATFGRGRCARATHLLEPHAGAIDVAHLTALLRDHGVEAEGDPDWSPAKTVSRTICMHAAEGARRSQTVASWVADLAGPRAVHWVTGTAAPCLSLFKPLVVGGLVPDQGPPLSARFDPASLWWWHESFHRAALADFPAVLAAITAERDEVEAGFSDRMAAALRSGEVDAAIDECWREAAVVEDRWRSTLPASLPRQVKPTAASRSWARLNQRAGI